MELKYEPQIRLLRVITRFNSFVFVLLFYLLFLQVHQSNHICHRALNPCVSLVSPCVSWGSSSQHTHTVILGRIHCIDLHSFMPTHSQTQSSCCFSWARVLGVVWSSSWECSTRIPILFIRIHSPTLIYPALSLVSVV